MDTTQIIIAVCGFTVFISVGLIVYIWADAKHAINTTVNDKTCNERMENGRKRMNCQDDKLRKHRHDGEGKVRIEL